MVVRKRDEMDTIFLAELEDLPDTIGPKPSPAFVANVKRLGVLIPIILDVDGNIVDGNRRVSAARANGLTHIPAMRLPGLANIEAPAMTIIANSMRSDNAATEYRAVAELNGWALDEKKITDLTGMPAVTIRKRLALQGVRYELREAFITGRIAPTTMDAVLMLDTIQQDKALSIFRELGKLTKAQVDDIRGPAEPARVEVTPEEARAQLAAALESAIHRYFTQTSGVPDVRITPTQLAVMVTANWAKEIEHERVDNPPDRSPGGQLDTDESGLPERGGTGVQPDSGDGPAIDYAVGEREG
jgi:hypothetical protein